METAWSDNPDPAADLRLQLKSASAMFGGTYDPPFHLFDLRTRQVVTFPLREWVAFVEHVTEREMVEGISWRGLMVRWTRWRRYRIAGSVGS